MLMSRERKNAALAIMMLIAFGVGCSQLKNLGGGSNLAEANKLIDSANKDLEDIQKITDDNKNKESDISKKLNKNDITGAKASMDDAIKAIDEGLEKGNSAADKFDKASKMDLDPKVKEYLSLKSQSVRKTVEAFQELRKGLVAVRDNVGNKDKTAVAKAQKDVQTSSDNFDKLVGEAQKLEKKADDIARENPDKIKG